MAQSGQIQFYTKEQVLAGTPTTGVPSITATDLFFLTRDNSINSTSTNFVIAGFAAGMQIVVSGSAGNNQQFVISSVSPAKMLLIDGTVNPENAGASVTLSGAYVLLVNQGNVPDAKLGERSWICTVCNQSFPASKIRQFRGKYYCIPNGDYKDIASILKTESARRYKPAGLGTERIIPPIIRG